MQNNNSEQDGRVRYVPVRLEGDGSENCRYVNNQHLDHGQPESMDFEPYLPFQYYNPQSQAHQQSQTGRNSSNNQTSQRAPTHTSSIDINYKPPPPSQNQKGTPKQPSHQPNGPSTGNNDAFSHANHSSRLSPQSDLRGFNKENRRSPADRNKSPTTCDSAIEKNSAEHEPQEQQPLKPEAVIPLPPPPEQSSRPSSNNSNREEKQGQHEEKNTSEKTDKVKQQESGPQGVINATKVEVNRLLQEIANCHETSLKSKEYLRLDELLTLCILKLDDIQSQEWRQQRKEVIILINKCTELLERKINLNRDIQQLSANCS